MNEQVQPGSELLSVVQNALCDVMGDRAPNIGMDTKLASLGIDSLGALELTAHFEDRLGLLLSDVVFTGVTTVSDLTLVLKGELDKCAGSSGAGS